MVMLALRGKTIKLPKYLNWHICCFVCFAKIESSEHQIRWLYLIIRLLNEIISVAVLPGDVKLVLAGVKGTVAQSLPMKTSVAVW